MAAPSQHILGIDPKMYRHFAVLTLVISLSVAFFANGEQNRALKEQPAPAAAPGKKVPHQRSEMDVLNGVPEDPSPVKASAPPPPPPAAPSDEQPMAIEPGDDGQFHPPKFVYRRPALRPDPALMAKMTPEQRKGYLRALALREQQEANAGQGGGGAGGSGPGGSGSGAPNQQMVNRLVEASRARSNGD